MGALLSIVSLLCVFACVQVIFPLKTQFFYFKNKDLAAAG